MCIRDRCSITVAIPTDLFNVVKSPGLVRAENVGGDTHVDGVALSKHRNITRVMALTTAEIIPPPL